MRSLSEQAVCLSLYENEKKCPPYLSISTHHHLFASKHDISGPLQAKDRNTIISLAA